MKSIQLNANNAVILMLIRSALLRVQLLAKTKQLFDYPNSNYEKNNISLKQREEYQVMTKLVFITRSKNKT
jgi:hypothetical protein